MVTASRLGQLAKCSHPIRDGFPARVRISSLSNVVSFFFSVCLVIPVACPPLPQLQHNPSSASSITIHLQYYQPWPPLQVRILPFANHSKNIDITCIPATGKLSREEFRRQKDLDAARKAGTAPAALDEEGKAINPHIPRQYTHTPSLSFNFS